MKFTDDDIIKALECCTDESGLCVGCPFWEDWEDEDLCRPYSLLGLALALINRQKAEIESLNAIHADALESLRLAAEANKDMQAEIERLNAELESRKLIITRRAETEIDDESQNT